MSNGLSQALGHLLQHDTNLRSQQRQFEMFGIENERAFRMHTDDIRLREQDLARLQLIADSQIKTQDRLATLQEGNAPYERGLLSAQTELAQWQADESRARAASARGGEARQQETHDELMRQARTAQARDAYEDINFAVQAGWDEARLKPMAANSIARLTGQDRETLLQRPLNELENELAVLAGAPDAVEMESMRISAADRTTAAPPPGYGAAGLPAALDTGAHGPGSPEFQLQHLARKELEKINELVETQFEGNLLEALRNPGVQRNMRQFMSAHPWVVNLIRERPLVNQDDPGFSMIDIGEGFSSGVVLNDQNRFAPLTPNAGRYGVTGGEYEETILAFSPTDMYQALQLMVEGGPEALRGGLEQHAAATAPANTFGAPNRTPSNVRDRALASVLTDRSNAAMNVEAPTRRRDRDQIAGGYGVGPDAAAAVSNLGARTEAENFQIRQAGQPVDVDAVETKNDTRFNRRVDSVTAELVSQLGKDSVGGGWIRPGWFETYSKSSNNPHWQGDIPKTIAADIRTTLLYPGQAERIAAGLGFRYSDGRLKRVEDWTQREIRDAANLIVNARKADRFSIFPQLNRDTYGVITDEDIKNFQQERPDRVRPNERRGMWE